nr:hypothetical protein [Candidatus Sigynarchaeota archaeon]
MVPDINKGKAWQIGIAELHVPPFALQWEAIGPKHPLWIERIKLEITLIHKYIDYLCSEKSKPWFYIKPDTSPSIKGIVWRGNILVPAKPEINFDIVIVLNLDYPKVAPRAFVEERLIGLAGQKIYVKNRFPSEQDPRTGEWVKDPQTGKSYVMICHDHIAELEGAWTPNLGIVHFFIREVWYWFAAMQNQIVDLYNQQVDFSK